MTQYLSAKEFRARIPSISDDLKRWKEIIVLKKSKPIFKVVPFEEVPEDLLERAEATIDPVQLELDEISKIVHKIRNRA